METNNLKMFIITTDIGFDKWIQLSVHSRSYQIRIQNYIHLKPILYGLEKYMSYQELYTKPLIPSKLEHGVRNIIFRNASHH